MDVSFGISRTRLYGETEVVEIPREEWEPRWSEAMVAACYQYTWRPPYQIDSRTPDDFDLSFCCTADGNGCRRFTPLHDTGAFLQFAGVLGHLLLEDRNETCSDLPLTNDEFRLVGNYVRHTREFIGPTRRFEQQVRITSDGTAGGGEESRDILPSDLGLDDRGNGERWGYGQLMDEGLAAAKAAGVRNPTLKMRFAHGLDAAARLAPHGLQDGEARFVIRNLLFSFAASVFAPERAGVEAKRASQEFVVKELKVVIKDHLYDSTEKFEEWMNDRSSNLFRRISKKKHCPTGRAGVRQIIAELGAQAMWLQGDGVDVAMRAFRDTIPTPLTSYEGKLFDLMYLKQREFGDLPLVMLTDRFDFLSPTILSMWNHPDDENALRIFYRVATWFQEILEKRRDGDRRLHPQKSRCTESDDGLNASVLVTSVDWRDALQSLIEAQLECDLELHEWEVESFDRDGASRKYRVICPTQQIDTIMSFTRADLSSVGYKDPDDDCEL